MMTTEHNKGGGGATPSTPARPTFGGLTGVVGEDEKAKLKKAGFGMGISGGDTTPIAPKHEASKPKKKAAARPKTGAKPSKSGTRRGRPPVLDKTVERKGTQMFLTKEERDLLKPIHPDPKKQNMTDGVRYMLQWRTKAESLFNALPEAKREKLHNNRDDRELVMALLPIVRQHEPTNS